MATLPLRMTQLPKPLYAAHVWTDAAGQLEQLTVLRGDALETYCRESAANAAEHGHKDVTESDLKELHAWLANQGA